MPRIINLRKAMCVLAGTALALGVAGCGGGSKGDAEDRTWVHAIVTPKGDAGFILMAQARKYFEKQGIKVQIKNFTGNIPLNQALQSGDVDSIETSPDPVFDASLRGGDVKIIGSTLPGLTYSVIAQKKVRSFDDLKGKKIGVSLPGSLPDVAVRAMLASKKLDPKSVQVINVGNDAQRFQAISAGRVDAAAVSPEFVPRIKNSKTLHELGAAEDIIPEYPRFVIAANGKSLEEKPGTAARFLAAEMQGISYAAAHKKEALELSAKTLKMESNDPSLDYFYDRIIKTESESRKCEIPRDKLEWLQDFRMETGLQKKKVDLDELLDDSFQKEALKRVGDDLGAAGS